MEWVCVVLILCTMVYCGHIIVECLNYDVGIRPRLSKLKQRVLELADCAEAEIKVRDNARARCNLHRPEIEDLQQTIEGIRQKVKTEGLRKNRLEMVLLKSSLRHTPRLNMALG